MAHCGVAAVTMAKIMELDGKNKWDG